MAIAVITGASSGMGREFVRQIAEKYPKLQEIWVIARRKERLEELKSMTPVRLRIFDYDLDVYKRQGEPRGAGAGSVRRTRREVDRTGCEA